MKIGEFEIELAKGITVFVESNSSVKSTIIENLRKSIQPNGIPTENDFNNGIIAKLENQFIEFTKNDAVLQIKGFGLDNHSYDLCIDTKQGEQIQFSQLSDGYKRIFSILEYIGYRSSFGSLGTVFIDDSDLDLHPMSLKTVLSRLHNTFPNVQFIVSTRSPIVLSHLNTSVDKDGVQQNKAYLLQADGSAPLLLPNLYGVDYNAVLRDFMGVPDRCQDIKELKDEYFSYKEMGMENEASTIYDKIKGIVGENGAILKELK